MKKLFLLLPLAAGLILSGCDKNDEDAPVVVVPPVAAIKPNVPFVGLTASNTLVTYNANATEGAGTSLVLTGLQAGETIAAIDFRPGTGQLYGISNQSRLYILNAVSGAATAIGIAPFTPALSGTVTGFDFNPTVDRIRVITSTGQNFRINPETGIVTTDTNISPAGTQVTGVAYNNNTAGSTTTILYGIDLAAKNLIKFDLPNGGIASTIGGLTVTASAIADFDISADNANALAAFTSGGTSMLYQINLSSGKATAIGNIGTALIGLAIPTNPIAYAVSGSNLLIFNPTGTTLTTVSKAITGMGAETVLGIDIRPATGQLFALGSSGNIYTLNTSTGAAALLSAAPLTLIGTSFGFDFNPMVDRIRIISNTGQNLRANPNDGALAATDTNLTPGTPNASAAAYTNNFPGATTTVLYAIDYTTDQLVTFTGSPNAGVLANVGPLGINADAANGFDIGGVSGKAYAVLSTGAVTKLYTINLSTGAATALGDFPSGVTGFTVGNGF